MPLAPKVMVGGTEIRRAYLGTTVLFDRTSPPLAEIEEIAQVAAVFVADPAYLFQDTAATTPVTAGGQSVGAWQDTSGLYTLTLVGSGVTYQESGGLAWVESDGNGRLQGPAPNDWTPDLMLAVAATAEGSGHTRPMTLADTTRISDQHNLQLTDDGKSGIRDRDFVPDPSIDCWTTFTTTTSKAYVINAVIDASSNRARARINGSADQEADTPGANQVVGIYTGETTDELCFCGEPGNTPETTANKVFAGVVAVGIPSNTDRDLIDQWLAARSGATLDGVMP
jgi:hypothetical protein